MQHNDTVPVPPGDVGGVNPREASAVISGLSVDVLRAMRVAVPIALREALGDIEPSRLERAAEVILFETEARYRTHTGATIRPKHGQRIA